MPTSQFVDGTAREPTARDLAVVRLIPAVLGRVDAVRLPKVQPRRAVLRLEQRNEILAALRPFYETISLDLEVRP